MINTGSHYFPLGITIVTLMHVQFLQMYNDVKIIFKNHFYYLAAS